MNDRMMTRTNCSGLGSFVVADLSAPGRATAIAALLGSMLERRRGVFWGVEVRK